MMTMPELDYRRVQASTVDVRNALQEFAHTLGRHGGRLPGNFLTPDLGVITTSMDEPAFQPQSAQHVVRPTVSPDVQARHLREMALFLDRSQDETLRLPSKNDEFMERAYPHGTTWLTGRELERRLSHSEGTLARNLHRLPPIIVTQEASAFADAANLRTEADVVCRLVLRLPAAEHARMTVVHDHEDGRSNLHVTVRTSAAVDEVVGAEDKLHDALFDNLAPASRSLFSIGYEFSG